MATSPEVSTPAAHSSDSTGSEAGASVRNISRAHLVNRLNFLNFQDQGVLIGLRHVCYDNAITLRARPQPCAGERLDCTWAEPAGLRQLLSNYRFDHLLIPDGKKYLLVNPEILSLDEAGLSCNLPLTCREFQLRKIRRHPSTGVVAQISQHGALLTGEMVDFTPISVKVEAQAGAPQTLYWINPETPVNLRLAVGETVVYSGACEVLWRSRLRLGSSFVLKQINHNLQRFKAKCYRNSRQILVPSPSVSFEHPLIARRVNLKVVDLSGSGFSVEEAEEDSVLMPGMIIPELKLHFAMVLSLRLKAQVVFRNPVASGTEGGRVRCGLAILDMDIRDHVKLLSLLHQVANQRSSVGTEVDLDELWGFFFETGFIYPEKYAYFQANKEQIKRTYAKLYEENPQIARHFIYQDHVAILGHMAMVRVYPDSWLIHHHAARRTASVKAGLAVLDQVRHYINELDNFYFAHLKYVFCYFRPDNKFPNRMFGEFARRNGNPRQCSLDRFGYARFRGKDPRPELPEGWELVLSSGFDQAELASFYEYSSGGLLVDAFELGRCQTGPDLLAQEYRELGFRKETFCYSLRKDGALQAFLLVCCTDAGLNMADLTNCVSTFLLDPKLPGEVLSACYELVSEHFEGGEMPVLTYPAVSQEGQGGDFDKVYDLWILDLAFSDRYFVFCDALMSSTRRSAAPTTGAAT
ncbi:hypothetical protein GMST_23120 [Geomonas silvestris]|uniref:Pilus assembly protein PilZ n=1 Tax=Geomonas silvestris TaxID=2740184 RepID=A0A6V8MJ56_9BACT|nr:pilus assembly protein PilZ [Geomonas silvestris]GFO59987.1 hypothetical protein GMST_23120 [Geomonas silvestris]